MENISDSDIREGILLLNGIAQKPELVHDKTEEELKKLLVLAVAILSSLRELLSLLGIAPPDLERNLEE